MELNGVADSGEYNNEPRDRSESENSTSTDALIVSKESISSALSAVSGAGSESSRNSQDTCVNVHDFSLKNGAPPKPDESPAKTPQSDCATPSSDVKVPPVAVVTPGRRKKVFTVEKVKEEKPKDETDSPVKELPLAALFKPQEPDKTDSPSERPIFYLPEEEPGEKLSPSRIRKDSLTKRRKSQDESGKGKDLSPSPSRKESKAESAKVPSPSGRRKNSLSLGLRKVSIDASPPRKKSSKDESTKPRNRAGTADSAEAAEESLKDQVLELPKIKKKTKFGRRRVSYDDHVVKIPTDDEAVPDDVFDEDSHLNDEKDEFDEEENLIIPQLKKRRPLFRPHDRGIKILLIVLFLVMVGGITCIMIFYKKQLYEVKIGKKITFNEDTRTLIVHEFGTKNVALKSTFGLNIPRLLPYLCSDEHHQTELCLRWRDHAVLNIKYWDATDDIGCYNISWRMLSDTFIPRDCFSMENANWYGGGLVGEQLWPLEKQEYSEIPFVTGNILDGQYGSVVQAYWFSSQGIALVVPTDVPLWAGINATQTGGARGLCLSATYNGPYRQLSDTIGSNMEYRLCKGPNFKAVHEFMISEVVESTSHAPADDYLQYPGWSTWGKYGKNITQEKVLALYNEIKQNNFPASHLEIYDKWESDYGELEFDLEKFPNPKQLVSELTKDGVEVMVCVHPFIDSRSETFQVGIQEQYFVMNEDDKVPGLTHWWDSVGAVVDFTSSRTSAWFKSRLLALQNQTGIKSFRFDAGEVSWLPNKPHFSIPQVNPLQYSRRYVEFADSLGGKTIVTSSFQNQDIPVIIRIHDLSPTWGYDNGLKSIIPTVLTLNLLGYPYLQLQVGGGGDNLQGVKNTSFSDSFPSRDLYLRTLQIAIFLPSFQFSVLPWQYDNEMTQIAKKYVKFHEDFVLPKIKTLISNYTNKGLPILRPLWWVEDTLQSRTIDSEFLIGDTVLVAPILQANVSKRDIYLPRGNWKDPFKQMVVEGGTWLKHYTVPTNVVPYFVLV